MNAKQAIARLSKLLGQSELGWRENSRALDAAGRAEQSVLAKQLREREKAAKAALDASRERLLADPAHVALREAHWALKEQADAAQGASHSYRLTVGKPRGMFFHVLIQGDNWADVVATAEAQKSKKETA